MGFAGRGVRLRRRLGGRAGADRGGHRLAGHGRLIQRGLQPLAQFAGHLPLAQRQRPGHQPHHDGLTGHRLDPPDLRLLHDHVMPARLLPHLGRGVLHGLPDPGQVLVVGDREVDHRAGPALGLVADPVDRAVAHVPDHAVDVAQPGHPQADPLDRAGGGARVDDVADAVLVLQHHEDPGQVVTDQALRAEADGQAEHPGAGQHRGQVQPEITGDGHRGDAEDEHRRRVAQHRPECLGALPPPLADQHVRRVGLAVARLGRVLGDLPDQPERDQPDHDGHQQHQDDLQHQGDRAGQPHVDQLGGRLAVRHIPGEAAGDTRVGATGVPQGLIGVGGEAERRDERLRGHRDSPFADQQGAWGPGADSP